MSFDVNVETVYAAAVLHQLDFNCGEKDDDDVA